MKPLNRFYAGMFAAGLAIASPLPAYAISIPGSVGDLLDDIGFGDTVGGETFLDDVGQQWSEDILPALRDMTKQLHTATLDQTRLEGSIHDARNLIKTQQDVHSRELESYKRHFPSEMTCQAYSAGSGMVRTFSIGDMVRTAIGEQAASIWSNSPRVGRDTLTSLPIPAPSIVPASLPASSIPGFNSFTLAGASDTDLNSGAVEAVDWHWQVYARITCDPEGNKGFPGSDCVGIPTYKNADVLVGQWLLDRKTLDLSDPALRMAVEVLMINNLAGPFPYDAIPPSAFDSPNGANTWQQRRSHLSKREAVYDVFAAMIGRRALGGNPDQPGMMGEWVQKLREAAGILPEEISPDPSYNEIMHVMTKERYWNPEYFIRLSTAEDELIKEQAVIEAFTTLQKRDLYEIQEQISMLLAIRNSLLQNKTLIEDEGATMELPVKN